MIKKLILILSLLIVTVEANAMNIKTPSLSLTVGYPYMVIQGNNPIFASDFVSLAFGAVMEQKINPFHSIEVIIDASYSPKRVNFNFERSSRNADGDTSLLTSFYSLNYKYKYLNHDGYDYSFSVGPSHGIYTLNYINIEDSELDVSEVNRIRVSNTGLRLGFQFKEVKTQDFYEVAFLYSTQDKYTLIDDATNDAEQIREINDLKKKKTWAIMFNYGVLLF